MNLSLLVPQSPQRPCLSMPSQSSDLPWRKQPPDHRIRRLYIVPIPRIDRKYLVASDYPATRYRVEISTAAEPFPLLPLPDNGTLYPRHVSVKLKGISGARDGCLCLIGVPSGIGQRTWCGPVTATRKRRNLSSSTSERPRKTRCLERHRDERRGVVGGAGEDLFGLLARHPALFGL